MGLQSRDMTAGRAVVGVVVPLLIALALAPVCPADSQHQLLVIVRNGKYGYINHEGKIVIQPQFIWAGGFLQGLGIVYVCGHYASIDASGNFHAARIALKGGLQPRERSGNFGFVDASGKFKIPPTFEDAYPFSQGLAAVQKENKWGFINTKGDIVIRPRFKAAFYFQNGVGVVEDESGFAIIDRVGNVVASGFSYIDWINEGRVPASGEKWSGFLDVAGKVVIPFIYGSVQPFSEGLAAVGKDGKWGYVDRRGRVVIPIQFDMAGKFGHGLAPVRLGKQTIFIDHAGKSAFVLAIDGAYSEGFAAGSDISTFWTEDQQFGYVNTSGRVIWGPTRESPDHQPLLGWTEDDKLTSCKGIPESTRAIVSRLPDR
jgi:WG containing repeat